MASADRNASFRSPQGLEDLGVGGGFVLCLDAEAEWFNIAEEEHERDTPTPRCQDAKVMPPAEETGSLAPAVSAQDPCIGTMSDREPSIAEADAIEASTPAPDGTPTVAEVTAQQQQQPQPQPSPQQNEASLAPLPPSQPPLVHGEVQTDSELRQVLDEFQRVSMRVEVLSVSMLTCGILFGILFFSGVTAQYDLKTCHQMVTSNKELATSYNELVTANFTTCRQELADHKVRLEEMLEESRRGTEAENEVEEEEEREQAENEEGEDDSQHAQDSSRQCGDSYQGVGPCGPGECDAGARRGLFFRGKSPRLARVVGRDANGLGEGHCGAGAERKEPRSHVKEFLHTWHYGLQTLEKMKRKVKKGKKGKKEGKEFRDVVRKMNDAVRQVRREYEETGESALVQAIAAMCALVPKFSIDKVDCFPL